jgi:hypothetical protein
MKKLFKAFPKTIVMITVGVCLFTWVKVFGNPGTIPVGENAVIITGECIVINYDATEAEFDAAKVAWLEALETYPR